MQSHDLSFQSTHQPANTMDTLYTPTDPNLTGSQALPFLQNCIDRIAQMAVLTGTSDQAIRRHFSEHVLYFNAVLPVLDQAFQLPVTFLRWSYAPITRLAPHLQPPANQSRTTSRPMIRHWGIITHTSPWLLRTKAHTLTILRFSLVKLPPPPPRLVLMLIRTRSTRLGLMAHRLTVVTDRALPSSRTR